MDFSLTLTTPSQLITSHFNSVNRTLLLLFLNILLVVLSRTDLQGLHVSAVMADSRLCQEDLGKQIPQARLGCQDLTL